MSAPCEGCGHARAEHSAGLSLSPFAAVRCTVDGCGCFNFRAPADRGSDGENYDADRSEELVGDMYSSEAPYVPLHPRYFNASRPMTPAAKSPLIHVEPAAGSNSTGRPANTPPRGMAVETTERTSGAPVTRDAA